jgi:enoyl-CoA hydratase/carnithine racemase
MVLTGEIVTADRALELGLVDRVSAEGEVRTVAEELAERIAELPANAVQNAKRAVRAALEVGIDERLALERSLFLETSGTADASEGVAAFLDKRAPEFGHG